MFGWLRRYHKSLVAKGQKSRPMDRYFDVQLVCVPWFLPAIPILVWGLTFDPPDGIRHLVALAVGIPMVVGVFYAGTTYVVSGILSDMRKRRSEDNGN